MTKNAEILHLESSRQEIKEQKNVRLASGHEVHISSNNHEETVEIIASNGDALIKIEITDKGPVVCLQGAHLKLRSTESIELDAKKIDIRAQEEATVESNGKLELNASQKMNIHSEDDVKIVGKMVHIN